MKESLRRWISSLLIILLAFSIDLGTWNSIPVEAASNIKVGGIDIGYALGDYFSKNGKQCTCHGRHTCGQASDCNCKIVSGCCQCYGFALWVENKLFGYNDVSSRGNFTNYGSISAGSMNVTNLKKLISKAPIGSHIRTGGSQHSMIITEKTDNGFTIIQANGSNNNNYSGYYRCRIGTTKYTWSGYVSSTYGKRGISFVKGREGIKPVPDNEFTKDTRYPSSFKGYPISTSGNISVYDNGLSQYSGRYISTGDLCTIHEVYTNGYCKVTYPTSNGTFTAYAEKSAFIGSDDAPYSYKPEQNYTTYTRSDLKTTFGSVFTTDNCTVVANGGSGKLQLIYPISGGYKIGWIQNTIVTPSQLVTPILGYNASSSAKTPVYQYESTLGETKYGEIFVDDLCTLNKVNIDKNWIKVTYSVSSGTKTGYVYLNQFFPSFVGKEKIRTAKVSKNATVYRKSDRKTSNGTIYPSDTITVVGKSGNNIQVLYPITEGSNKGKYKLGWILNSEIVNNLQRIAVTSNPVKTEYLEGESLNTNGLAVTAYYEDGSTANVTGSCSLNGYDSSPGTKTVTVSYSGQVSAFTVTVDMKSPTALTITQNPNKTHYFVNDEFDTSGLKALATFNNNTTEDVSSEVFCTVEDEFDTPGTKNIAVQYLYNFKTVSASLTVTVSGKEISAGYDRVLPDGDYMIVSAADPSYFLDIPGTDVPAADGSNVEICGPNTGNLGIHDIWTISYSDGFYTICQKGSDAALDVQDGSTELSANVQAWQKNGNSCQKWAVSHFDGSRGYRIQSKCSGMSLDIADGNISNGTNVRQCSDNSSDAQRWLFIPYEPGKPVEDGRYVLVSRLDPHIVLDVSGDTGDVPDGGNVQIWNDQAPSQFNSFDVKYEGNGYYNLFHAASGKCLEVDGAGTANWVNIQISAPSGANSQKWCIFPQNDGYMLVNRNSGLVMDVDNGQTEDGTNVRQHYYNGSYAQTWSFKKAEYSVKYDANGGSGAPEVQTKYYANALTLSSRTPSFGNRIFKGWAENKKAEAAQYQPGAGFTEDRDVTLYAVWEEPAPGPDPNAAGKVSAASVEAGAGETVAVPIMLDENPGIIGINVLMGYDADRLRLVKVEAGEILDGSSMSGNYTKNPYKLSLSNETSADNIEGNGVLATAYFELLDGFNEGEAQVSLTFEEAYDKDLNEVAFRTESGKVSIRTYIPGDVNRDGQVKLNDAILLRRYVAGWDVDIDLQAADVNRDRQVKLNDAIILRRYVAGWDVELK